MSPRHKMEVFADIYFTALNMKKALWERKTLKEIK